LGGEGTCSYPAELNKQTFFEFDRGFGALRLHYRKKS